MLMQCKMGNEHGISHSIQMNQIRVDNITTVDWYIAGSSVGSWSYRVSTYTYRGILLTKDGNNPSAELGNTTWEVGRAVYIIYRILSEICAALNNVRFKKNRGCTTDWMWFPSYTKFEIETRPKQGVCYKSEVHVSLRDYGRSIDVLHSGQICVLFCT